ncbi:conserved hypothetical protein, partial [Ricinus communis]
MLARETPLRQQRQQQLGRRAHDAAGGRMPAEHAALCVRHRHVQVRAVSRDRARQHQDFQVAAQRGGVRRAGIPQLRHAQAANALQHKAGL